MALEGGQAQAGPIEPTVTVVDAGQTSGRVFVDPHTPAQPEASPEPPAVPAMPEGGQEKYYDPETGAYNWEAAFKEQAWIAQQQQATAEPAPAEGGQDAPGAEPAEPVSAEEFNAAVVENEGRVPDELIARFPGVDPEIIQDYAATMYDKAMTHIESVQEFLGGDTGLANLRDFMSKNMERAEIEGFEQQLMNPGTWRAAAMTLLQLAGLPQPGRGLVKGPNAQSTATSGVETFADEGEMIAAMRNPEYKTNPQYRKRVENAVRNSPHLMTGSVKHSL